MVSYLAKGTIAVEHASTDRIVKYVVNPPHSFSLGQEQYFGIYRADGSLRQFISRHMLTTTEDFQTCAAHAMRADQVYPSV